MWYELIQCTPNGMHQLSEESLVAFRSITKHTRILSVAKLGELTDNAFVKTLALLHLMHQRNLPVDHILRETFEYTTAPDGSVVLSDRTFSHLLQETMLREAEEKEPHADFVPWAFDNEATLEVEHLGEKIFLEEVSTDLTVLPVITIEFSFSVWDV